MKQAGRGIVVIGQVLVAILANCQLLTCPGVPWMAKCFLLPITAMTAITRDHGDSDGLPFNSCAVYKLTGITNRL